MPTSSSRKNSMKSFTRSCTAVQVERMEIGVSRVVSSTSRMLRPSTPRKYWMLKPATVIQGTRATSCRSGLEPLNIANTHSESPNVMVEVMRAVQRRAFFASGLMKSSASTPSSGKKVITVRGWKKFIGLPQFISAGWYAGTAKISAKEDVADNGNHADEHRQRVAAHEAVLDA